MRLETLTLACCYVVRPGIAIMEGYSSMGRAPNSHINGHTGDFEEMDTTSAGCLPARSHSSSSFEPNLPDPLHFSGIESMHHWKDPFHDGVNVSHRFKPSQPAGTPHRIHQVHSSPELYMNSSLKVPLMNLSSRPDISRNTQQARHQIPLGHESFRSSWVNSQSSVVSSSAIAIPQRRHSPRCMHGGGRGVQASGPKYVAPDSMSGSVYRQRLQQRSHEKVRTMEPLQPCWFQLLHTTWIVSEIHLWCHRHNPFAKEYFLFVIFFHSEPAI